jgi:hypothetical protein
MAKSILDMGNEADRITLGVVLKTDILPWLTSTVIALLLCLGVGAMVASMNPNLPRADADAILYQRAFVFFVAMLVAACFMARRSRDKWTWLLATLTVLYFILGNNISIITAVYPNSILPALLAMIAMLAAGRLIEYMILRLTTVIAPVLSATAIIIYVLGIIVPIGLNSTFIYKLIS